MVLDCGLWATCNCTQTVIYTDRHPPAPLIFPVQITPTQVYTVCRTALLFVYVCNRLGGGLHLEDLLRIDKSINVMGACLPPPPPSHCQQSNNLLHCLSRPQRHWEFVGGPINDWPLSSCPMVIFLALHVENCQSLGDPHIFSRSGPVIVVQGSATVIFLGYVILPRSY